MTVATCRHGQPCLSAVRGKGHNVAASHSLCVLCNNCVTFSSTGTRGSTVHFRHILLYEEVRVFGPSYTRKCVFLDPLRGSSGFSILLIWRLARRHRSLRFALPLRSPRPNVKQPPRSRPGSNLFHAKRINVLFCSHFMRRDMLVGIGAHMNRKGGGTSCTNCSYIIPAHRRQHLHLQCFAVAFYSVQPHISPSLVH